MPGHPFPPFKVFTICGSMRYYKAMIAIAQSKTAEGYIILMPFVAYNNGVKESGDEFAEMLDRMHKQKIDMSEGIFVVGSHIGESTQSEIDYAFINGKAIIRYESIDHSKEMT